MAQVETKLGRVQAVAGEGVVDSSVKAQQLQAGLSQLSTSLANFGKASEKRRIQNDIITARTAFALNQEMPGSLAPEAEIAFNDMVAVKSTNQFFRLLSDDAEVFGNQVLIDDEVYPDHNTKQAAFEDFIDGSKKTFFDQAQFNDAQQSSILASVVEKVGKLKDSFSILAAKDIKALKLNETAAFVQESIINIADSFKQSIETASSLGDDKVGKDSSFSGGEMSGMLEGSEGMGAFSKYQRKPKFDRTWHEDLKKTIAKANPHLTQDELDDLIMDQIGLLATDPDDPHPEYLEYFTEPGKRGKPSLSIIPNLSEKARSLYVTARNNFIAHQKATSAAEVKYGKEQEQLAYDKAQSYIVEEVGNIDGGQRDLLKLHANVRKLFPKISPTHLKAVINYANTLITASANEGDADLTITLKQQASLGTLSLEDLNSHPLKKTLSQKQLVSIHEQILRYSQGKVTERQNNVNAESKSFKEQLIIGIQTNKKVLFNGKQYSLRKGERIAFNPITNRMEGLSALNSFAVDSLVNEYIRRADNVLLDEHNATASDVRRELAKLKNEMMSDAGLLAKQDQSEVYENVAKPNPYKVPTTKDLFDGIVSEEEEGSDLSVIVNKAPVAKNYNPTIHLPPNKQLTMGQVLQKDFKDKNTAIKDAVLGSPKATEPNTPKTEAPKTETPSSTLSIPEQRKAAFDKAAPDVPNERSSLRNLQDDAKFQSDRTIIDLIKDLTTSKKRTLNEEDTSISSDVSAAVSGSTKSVPVAEASKKEAQPVIENLLDSIYIAEGKDKASVPFGMFTEDFKTRRDNGEQIPVAEAREETAKHLNRHIKLWETNNSRNVDRAEERGLVNANPEKVKAIQEGKFTPEFLKWYGEIYAPTSSANNNLSEAEKTKNVNWLKNVTSNIKSKVTPSPSTEESPNLKVSALEKMFGRSEAEASQIQMMGNTTGKSREISPTVYKIKQGDSLSKIAKANNMTVQELQKLNNIKDVNKIRAGQVINVGKFSMDIKDVKPPQVPDEVPKFFKENLIPVYGSHAQAALKHMIASQIEKSGLPVPDYLKKTITEKSFAPDVLNSVRVAAYKALINKRPTSYRDYGDAWKLVYGNERNKMSYTGQVLKALSSVFDPGMAAAFTIGESAGVVVRNGNLMIVGDEFNFPQISKKTKGKDPWLNFNSWFADKDAPFSVTPKNRQKIEINLGPIANVKRYVNNLKTKKVKKGKL